MIKKIKNSIIGILIIVVFAVYAKANYKVVYNGKIEKTLPLLRQNAAKSGIAKKPIGYVMAWVALQLLNKPYVANLLDKSSREYLYISLDDTDNMLFIDEVLATARLIKQNTLSLDNLTFAIKNIRYHGDVSFCNRNHYFKDWIWENTSKGLVYDEGYQLTHQLYSIQVHKFSNMFHNMFNIHYKRSACIEDRENYINNYEKIGFISMQQLPQYLNKIHSGDIIGIMENSITGNGGYKLGIADVENGVVKIVNASSVQKHVALTPNLIAYLKQLKNVSGIALIRANNV